MTEKKHTQKDDDDEDNNNDDDDDNDGDDDVDDFDGKNIKVYCWMLNEKAEGHTSSTKQISK